MIDYTKKLNTSREVYPINDIDISVESDRGRIISTPAFRRLQKRTQVFPLELNAAVRSRLTHSIEVQQNARYIAKTILDEIKKHSNFEKYNLNNLDNAFVSISEMSSLLHDIGNPPFGHFAELSINDWMKNEGVDCLKKLYPKIKKENESLKEKLIRDITNFDGNAQAIRIIKYLQRLNLSFSQTASVLKYTRGAFEEKPKDGDKLNYLKKKPGFYYSEKEFVKKVCKSLQMQKGCRFPLTYIMEAADDISYLTADIEDAVDKGVFTLDDLYKYVVKECNKVNQKYNKHETFLLELIEKYYKKAKEQEDEPYQFNLFLTLTRASLINHLVKYVAQVYLDNHQEIFDGTFNKAILDFDKTNKYSLAIEVLQNISIKYIYNNKEKQALELKGHAILHGLLNCYKPILELSSEDFLKLVSKQRIDCFVSARLIGRLSSKHIVAYSKAIEELDTKDKQKFNLLEWYYRARLIIDYISGMTDDFALDEYRKLTAI
ncbi:dGTPase [Malaciobacter molluscorum LMG 25693]|uniref:dGTP triphosphohydrolase n=1 Tax=Malaciobacter molluscorum LMG 25693 TaxID=870501 RepID=A0A2G1DJV0_9BACT|nr:dGTPase [Malaciobacter molluscorum]AXX92945.1 dGTP triphosphohydrolase [Malaciobacter molluscorum LMG 25693]PHO18775.1 dGTPase [Malaciobacter molluscorum LMG 25693]